VSDCAVSIKNFRMKSDSVKAQVETRIPTRNHGTYRVILYSNTLDNKEHMALVFGSSIQSASLRSASATPNSPISMNSSSSASTCDAHTLVDTIDSPVLTGNINEQNEVSSSDSAHTSCKPSSSILARVHSSCFTGETLLSSRCDCAVSFNSLLTDVGSTK
jgi:GTP cyclohydrolase II